WLPATDDDPGVDAKRHETRANRGRAGRFEPTGSWPRRKIDPARDWDRPCGRLRPGPTDHRQIPPRRTSVLRRAGVCRHPSRHEADARLSCRRGCAVDAYVTACRASLSGANPAPILALMRRIPIDPIFAPEPEAPLRACDHPGCTGGGDFRAPKSRL